jgi:hypothetical protein
MNSDAHERDGRSAAAAMPRMDDRAEALNCAYFYYVTPGRIGNDGHFHANVRAFLMQEGDFASSRDIKELIPEWAQRAKNNQMTPVGWGLGDLRWRRKSYFIVVLDAADWDFTSERQLSIREESETFSDKTLLKFTTADGTEMQAIYCRNHIRKKGGGEWDPHGGDHDTYELELNPTRRGAVADSPRRDRDHDDVGTNTGPPVGGGGGNP